MRTDVRSRIEALERQAAGPIQLRVVFEDDLAGDEDPRSVIRLQWPDVPQEDNEEEGSP